MFDNWGRVTPEYELKTIEETIETFKGNIRFYKGLINDEDEDIREMGENGLKFSRESLRKLLEEKSKLEKELEVM